MFGWFDRLPDDDYIEWVFETYRWLFENFGGWPCFDQRRLILPTRDFYPTLDCAPHAFAEQYFNLTKGYVGLQNLPCRLVEQDEIPSIHPFGGDSKGAAGTFSVDWRAKEVTISYDPDGVREPQGLVATFAHELSHYITMFTPNPPPSGEIAEEFATDLCAVFLGYGIYMANSVFTFESFRTIDGHGWRASRKGYLNELELSYGLAIFCALKGIDAKVPAKYLKTNPKSYLLSAAKHVGSKHTADIAGLKNVKVTRPWP
ncbi:MAG: hypothetical protein L6R28_23305 [Planctomycetes bacterium]|nr:hypothetical protein [Planctomycetota bacterium]